MAKPLRSYRYTDVALHRSREQIETLLAKVGADGFRWSSFGNREVFEALLGLRGKRIAFRLSIAYSGEQERRQYLRALYWYLKAKVEAIIFGLVDIEREFLPHLLTASGRTVFEELEMTERPGWLLEAPKEAAEPAL